jgi:hypothetical protein
MSPACRALLCAGIRNHRGVHPLSQPGTADLSAWVDFSAMRMAAEQAFDIQPGTQSSAVGSSDSSSSGSSSGSSGGSSSGGVDVFGPVTQAHLLHSLGIQARLQALAEVGCILKCGRGGGRGGGGNSRCRPVGEGGWEGPCTCERWKGLRYAVRYLREQQSAILGVFCLRITVKVMTGWRTCCGFASGC